MTFSSLANAVARRAVRTGDRVIFGLARVRTEQLDARLNDLRTCLIWLRDELVARGERAAGDDATVDLARHDVHARLTNYAERLQPQTGAERNAARVVSSVLDRATADIAAALTPEDVAEALVAAVDDVHGYLLSHHLVVPVRSPRALTTRMRRLVPRQTVDGWSHAKRVTNEAPELVVHVGAHHTNVVRDDDLQLA